MRDVEAKGGEGRDLRLRSTGQPAVRRKWVCVGLPGSRACVFLSVDCRRQTLASTECRLSVMRADGRRA